MVSNTEFAKLKKEVQSNKLGQGVGYRLNRSGAGTTLTIKPGAGGSSDAVHPFKIYIKNLGTEETPIWKAGVEYNSSLFKSLKPNDRQTITGLLSEDYSTGWFSLMANDAIWLGITFDVDANITWAGIDSWGQSDAFDIDVAAWVSTGGKKSYVADDGSTTAPFHQTSRMLLGYTIAGSEGEPVLTQSVNSHLVLRNCLIDGRVCRYPFAHYGGYPF